MMMDPWYFFVGLFFFPFILFLFIYTPILFVFLICLWILSPLVGKIFFLLLFFVMVENWNDYGLYCYFGMTTVGIKKKNLG